MIKDLRLTIEVVPSSCWYSNVRSEISQSKWNIIKKITFSKANYRCEICGGVGKKWPVECHEVWEYVVKKGQKRIQKLMRFIALCPSCHEVKHIGRANVMGNFDRAINHFMQVNKVDNEFADYYMEKVERVFNNRSRIKWELDISYMTDLLAAYDKNNKFGRVDL